MKSSGVKMWNAHEQAKWKQNKMIKYDGFWNDCYYIKIVFDKVCF